MKNDVLLYFVKNEMLAGNTKCRVIHQKIKDELGEDVSLNRIYSRIDKVNRSDINLQKKRCSEDFFRGQRPITVKAMDAALKQIHRIICNCAKENPARTPTLEEANDIYAWCCYGLNIGEGKGEE